eukprot:m.392599 g.392599  ORF g.392599 m.392599 type:complete len:263 (+) comp56352_c0_seq14:214-1002(+)
MGPQTRRSSSRSTASAARQATRTPIGSQGTRLQTVGLGDCWPMIRGLSSALHSAFDFRYQGDHSYANRTIHQLWSTTHKFFVCLTLKSGCKSWLHLIRKMLLPAHVAERFTGVQQFNTAPLYEYGLFTRPHLFPEESAETYNSTLEAEAEAVLNDPDYFKFAIVRHPWGRVISAYRQKYKEVCRSDRTCLALRFKLSAISLREPKKPLSFHEFLEVRVIRLRLLLTSPCAFIQAIGSGAQEFPSRKASRLLLYFSLTCHFRR